MPDSFDSTAQSRATDAVPLVPPSSSEVTMRTMASDLEAMKQSGGLPSSPPVVLEPFAPVRAASVPSSAIEGSSWQAAPRGASGRAHQAVRIIMATVLIGVAVLALFGLGFYVIPLFAGR